MVVAHKSTSEEIGILRKVFEKYDTSKNGSISQEEFKVALETYGYTDEEVERMFEGLVSLKWRLITRACEKRILFISPLLFHRMWTEQAR